MVHTVRQNQRSPSDSDPRPRVVILGAGFAGLNAARILANKPVEVTLLDRHNYHLFQPLLYQVATAALSPGDIAYPIRAVTKRVPNVRVLLAEARDVNLAARCVELADGERIPYDYLIVATGAHHAYFGHDEWEPHAPGLKTLEDALEIRRRVLLAFEHAEREVDAAKRQALLTFVIIGGGPTGVELAGAIAEIARQVMVDDFREIDPRETRVLLVEGSARVLETFHEKLSAAAERALTSMGVEVILNTYVTDVGPGMVKLGDRPVAAETVLWAAGVRASSLGAKLGTKTDRAGRVFVEVNLTVPGHPEVFVTGDLAAYSPNGERPLPGIAPVAIQQGIHAARNVLRACRGERLLPFRYDDKGKMATIGRASAIAEFAGLRLTGVVAWLIWLFVHILYLIGFRNRLAVLVNWAWAYVRFQRAARLIVGRFSPRTGAGPSAANAKKDEGPASSS